MDEAPAPVDGATDTDDDGAAGVRDDAAADGAVATEMADPATEAAEPAADPGAELEALRAEMDALNDRHLRLAAEFDNYRKRNERERLEAWTRAQAELAGQLLDALDDLQRVAALDAAGVTVESLLEGVRLVEKKLRRALEAAGLEAIEAEGALFDPAAMEALMTVPAERPEDDDHVADVFQKGYRFKDVLIRPARVRVRKYEAGE